MFTGEYRHAIDVKGRMAVPHRFRAELAEGAYVTRWLDDCLAILPRQAWDELAEKLASLRLTDANARAFVRYLFANAFEVELDRQGRALVPAQLREQVGLKDEAVVVGMRERIELWAPDRWASVNAAMTPDALAQHFEGLGI